MPYIITTATPLRGEPVGEPLDRITRTAVATLDEAQVAVDRLVEEHGGSIDEHDDLRTDTATGLTVGPLPDGTVIEVRRVRWSAIADELPEYMPLFADGGYNKAILAAFNGAHA